VVAESLKGSLSVEGFEACLAWGRQGVPVERELSLYRSLLGRLWKEPGWEGLGLFQAPETQQMIDRSLELLRQSGRDEEFATLLGQLQRLQLRSQMAPTTRLREVQTNLAGLTEGLAQATPNPALPERLTATRAEFLTLMSQLRQDHPDMESLLTLRPRELGQLQSQLPEKLVVVQFYSAGHRLYEFTVSREGYDVHDMACESKELDQLIGQYRSAIQKGDRSLTASVGQRLSELLVLPWLGSAQGKEILLVPSGNLWSLPFEALPDSNGKPLVASRVLSYLATPDGLKGSVASPPWDAVLALGEPSGVNLPGSRAEVEWLGRFVPGAKLLLGEAGSTRSTSTAATSSSATAIWGWPTSMGSSCAPGRWWC
jgi:hypothetical protein